MQGNSLVCFAFTQSKLEAEILAAADVPLETPHVNFKDGSDTHAGRTLAADVAEGGAQAEAIHHFMLNMVLNQTVVPEAVTDADGKEVGMRLSASSPDEEAFVYTGTCAARLPRCLCVVAMPANLTLHVCVSACVAVHLLSCLLSWYFRLQVYQAQGGQGGGGD